MNGERSEHVTCYITTFLTATEHQRVSIVNKHLNALMIRAFDWSKPYSSLLGAQTRQLHVRYRAGQHWHEREGVRGNRFEQECNAEAYNKPHDSFNALLEGAPHLRIFSLHNLMTCRCPHVLQRSQFEFIVECIRRGTLDTCELAMQDYSMQYGVPVTLARRAKTRKLVLDIRNNPNMPWPFLYFAWYRVDTGRFEELEVKGRLLGTELDRLPPTLQQVVWYEPSWDEMYTWLHGQQNQFPHKDHSSDNPETVDRIKKLQLRRLHLRNLELVRDHPYLHGRHGYGILRWLMHLKELVIDSTVSVDDPYEVVRKCVSMLHRLFLDEDMFKTLEHCTIRVDFGIGKNAMALARGVCAYLTKEQPKWYRRTEGRPLLRTYRWKLRAQDTDVSRQWTCDDF